MFELCATRGILVEVEVLDRLTSYRFTSKDVEIAPHQPK